VIAGGFTSAGGSPALRIARWDGASWSLLGSGRSPASRTGAVLVGGSFAGSSNGSASFARAFTACPASAAVEGMGCAGHGRPGRARRGRAAVARRDVPCNRDRHATERARGCRMGRRPDVGAVAAAVPTQAGAGCDLLVAPDLLEVVVPVGGTAQTQLAIPDAAWWAMGRLCASRSCRSASARAARSRAARARKCCGRRSARCDAVRMGDALAP
jgi:hypothetical protein